jgi:hypothetical protein
VRKAVWLIGWITKSQLLVAILSPKSVFSSAPKVEDVAAQKRTMAAGIKK